MQMVFMIIFILVILIPIGIFHMNTKSVELFKYLDVHHHSLWVQLGSPMRVPGITNGSKEPAFTFVFEQGYERCNDQEVSVMCSNINKAAKSYAAGIFLTFMAAIIYGAASI